MALSASTASSSSSSSSSAPRPYTGKWEYDVFLCFRGDTRFNFMSHLREAFRQRQIKCFVDTMLTPMEDINKLLSVLERSAVSVVIFSEKFADSTWCLDEVDTIVRSMERLGHKGMPVFYQVDWTVVAGESGQYAETIAKLIDEDATEERKRQWKDALKAVAHKTGRTSEAIQDDAYLVKQVVEDVLSTLSAMSSGIQVSNLVGMDSRVLEVEHRLAMDEMDCIRIVGLRGMGGVGKTTLARACYEKLRFSAEDTKFHFVDRIGEKCDKQKGVEGMVLELYSALLSEEKLKREDLNIPYRRARLSRLRVFIVLDDVQTPSLLQELLLGHAWTPSKLFAVGSRVIVTTRNQQVLEYAKAEVHLVEGLNDVDSLQLFKLNGFEPNSPLGDWDDLSSQVVSYCKGNPLALKVLGGTLLRKDREYWVSFLCKLNEIQEPEILLVLRKSYDELGPEDKRLFLDIACSFLEILRPYMTNYLETGYTAAHSRVQDLIDKSLLICELCKNCGEVIIVHDLLREMAWNVVNEEEDVGKRSRVKNPDDVVDLLTLRKGVKSTQGINLDLSRVEKVTLKANAFDGMDSLSWLKFYWPKQRGHQKIFLPGGLNYLPNGIRCLTWDQFPSKSLPSGFSPQKLFNLNISSSPIERCWELQDQPKLPYLVVLNLSYCANLAAIPNLSSSSNLKILVCRGCKSLVELPGSVEDLMKLVKLDARDCENLQLVPARLKSKFVKTLKLSNCPKLTHCPEINSGKLELLDLMETLVEDLLLCDKHITSFPAISASLNLFRLCQTTIREMDFYDDDHQSSLLRFVQLELVDNPHLKRLSRNIWKMVSQTLLLEDSPLIESLPEISQPVNGLTELSIRGCGNLKSLPSGIDNLKSLQRLRFRGTDVKSLPACIQELDQLSWLDLSFNESLESIPSNIHKLAQLSTLDLRCCSRIPSLPELPLNLQILDVSYCESLQALPSNIGRLRLKKLNFETCPQLDTNLPTEIVQNFPNHATLSLHPQGLLIHSGSEIPEWFAYSCLMVRLPPPNCPVKRPLKGIKFGIVCSSDIPYIRMQMTCDCNISSNAAIASWSSPCLDFVGTPSQEVYIWYEKKQGIQEAAEPWYERYATGLTTVSFRFCLRVEKEEDVEKLKHVKITRAGVSLLY